MYQRDIDYIRGTFVPLSQACEAAGIDYAATQSEITDGKRPHPSYVLPDGTPYVPADYFSLVLDRDQFIARLLREYDRLSATPTANDIQEAWEGLLSGLYAVCLRHAMPEDIARKNIMLARIEALTADPDEFNEDWVASLREAVNELDHLENEFSPVYDRKRFGKPPTRDSHIQAIRARFPMIS